MCISKKFLDNKNMADSGITVKEIPIPTTQPTNTGRTLQMKLDRGKGDRNTHTHTPQLF